MPRPDSGAVDRAVISVLQADPTLAGLMPDGVWFNLATPGLRRCVLVTIDRSKDEDVFQQRGLEEYRYVVQAVGLSRDVSLSTMKQAAAQIDLLLDGQPLPIPTDFASIDSNRDERMTETVVDELDKSLHWHHFGGYYVVTAAWPDHVA